MNKNQNTHPYTHTHTHTHTRTHKRYSHRDLLLTVPRHRTITNIGLHILHSSFLSTIQIHGGAGVCQDFFLAKAYAGIRTLRIADGPDEVCLSVCSGNMILHGFLGIEGRGMSAV